MRSGLQRAAKRAFPLCALALAFGFVGVAAAVSHAVCSIEILLAGAASLVLALALAGIAANQFRQLADDRRIIGISLAVGATPGSLAVRYVTDMLADVAIAAALPCIALAALGIVFPNAMSGVTTMLALELLAPALALIVAVCSAIVWVAVRRSATESPLALINAT